MIEDISYEGAGVAKLDGKVVFVSKTLCGEKIEITAIKNHSRFMLARLENVISKSQYRIEANCPYFDICGGCDFQHCDYKHELQLKIQILKRELKKAVDFDKVEIESAEKRFEYRNKIKLVVFKNKIGYFKAKSHEFFEIDECVIATKEINEVLKILKSYLNENKYKNLKNVYIKQAGKNIGICFLFDKNAEKLRQKLKKHEKMNDFSIFFAYGDVLESNKTKIYCVQGNEKLSIEKNGLKMLVDISGFNQINDEISEKLYNYVLTYAKDKRIVNAYSGQGFLSAMLASVAKYVYGIEYQESSHLSAEKFTEDINNIKNICGKVEECLPKILMGDFIDLVVLDPAREGCDKSVLEQINSQKIKKIIYISCNFSTLTRDLKALSEKFGVESVKIFDMFPCTANMETVVVLSRKNE